MAIEYCSALGTPTPAAQVAHQPHDVARATGPLHTAITAGDLLTGTVTVHGTWIRVLEAKPEPWNAVVTDLGFTPTVRATVRLDKTGDMARQQDDMIHLVSACSAGPRRRGAALRVRVQSVGASRRRREPQRARPLARTPSGGHVPALWRAAPSFSD